MSLGGFCFASSGEVTSAKVITNKDSGSSRGFGFIEMSSSEDAQAAVKGLNHKVVAGRQMTVSVAMEKVDRPGVSSTNKSGNTHSRKW